MKCRLFMFLVMVLKIWIVSGQSIDYRNFQNIRIGNRFPAAECIMQDSLGMIWIGTYEGLFCYDGYSTYSHLFKDGKTGNYISCGQVLDSRRLILGADSGLQFYNYLTDTYENPGITFPPNIKAFLVQGDSLWICSLSGLYHYCFSTKKIKSIDLFKDCHVRYRVVYSIAENNGVLYLGTYDGLCAYNQKTEKVQFFGLPDNKGSNKLVNSLLFDKIRKVLWVGAESALYQFNVHNGQFIAIEDLSNISVRSMTLDDENNIVIGTDKGLFISDGYHFHHAIHDVRNSFSLASDVLRAVFKDNSGNIWIGSDYGLSLALSQTEMKYISLSQMTKDGTGNLIHAITKDSQGYFWLGGPNGLLRTKDFSENSTVWFRSEDVSSGIPNNRIKNIYEDRDGNIWIATDIGLGMYNARSKKFLSYKLINKEGVANFDWANYIVEDEFGSIWIGACLGGIGIVKKEKLLSSRGTNCVIDSNYTMKEGLSGSYVTEIEFDNYGYAWVITYLNKLNRINRQSGEIDTIPFQIINGDPIPLSMLNDRDHYVWIGCKDCVVRVDMHTLETHRIPLEGSENSDVRDFAFHLNVLYALTSDGLWKIDSASLNATKLFTYNDNLGCLYIDNSSGIAYIGCTDGLLAVYLNVIEKNIIKTHPIVLSALYVNNRLFSSLCAGEKESIRYAKRIKVNHRQNNIRVEVTSFPYSLRSKNAFIYRIDGSKRWNYLKSGNNEIQLSDLSYGKHLLEVGLPGPDGEPASNKVSLQITVTPPWYLSKIAISFYLLFVSGFVVLVVTYLSMKNKLKLESLEKEKTLDHVRSKMNFYSYISHEIKTPLSLIVAPLGKMIHDERNACIKKDLELLQSNARKLSQMIYSALDYDKDDAGIFALAPVPVDFIAFARNVFNTFKENYTRNGLEFIFSSTAEKLVVDLDVIKIESILTNLISNACKYSKEGGRIELKIEYDNKLFFTVSDNGIGIPERDIPYIFQKFYQSSNNHRSNEGTGLGLFLVKEMVHIHGGKIEVHSDLGVGTDFIVSIPVTLSELNDSNESSGNGLKNPLSEKEKYPFVLIVEDNQEMADFLSKSLSSDYECGVAHNGIEGLEICQKKIPDVIVTDVFMPLMDGLEMSGRVRKDPRLVTVPIVMLTAMNDNKTELQSIHLNIDMFITKPFDINMLRLRIGKLLEKQTCLKRQIQLEHIATPKMIDTLSYDEKFLSRITGIIEERIAEPGFNVNALSEISGINQKQLYRKIKCITGKTPVEYIKSIRMKEASMLLRRRTFTVAEVMYMVGFSNYSYFAKCFEAEFGKTPHEYLVS